ncbi:hypothetical protein DFH11DRAFT_76606 [Phellopilus nigrolimitatus]|nr:hypothetical protein DFH11DRAFT_76606 [Phellopilus nigrolimitatus]
MYLCTPILSFIYSYLFFLQCRVFAVRRKDVVSHTKLELVAREYSRRCVCPRGRSLAWVRIRERLVWTRSECTMSSRTDIDGLAGEYVLWTC